MIKRTIKQPALWGWLFSFLVVVSGCLSVSVAWADGETEAVVPIESASLAQLRAALAAEPENDQLRSALGYRLLLAERYGEALHHFEVLVATVKDPARRRLYQAVIAKILAERPAGVSLVFSLSPSSNLNSGSNQEELTTSFGTLSIDETSVEQSGWESSLGLSGFFRQSLNATDQIRLNWTAYRTFYSVDLIEDSRTAEASVMWSRKEGGGRQQALSFGHRVQESGADRRNSTFASIAGVSPLDERRLLQWSVSRTYQDYALDERKDGFDDTISLRHFWLRPNAENYSLGLSLFSSQPGYEHQQYLGAQIGVTRRFRWGEGPVIDLGFDLGHRDFDGDFPGFAYAREDTYGEVSIAAQTAAARFWGFAPRVNCSYRLTNSNIALYESDTLECGVTLSRQF